jgi:hypothetical protein
VRVDILIIVALQSRGLVCASCVTLFGAVVFTIFVWRLLVKRVATSNLGALFFELGLSRLGLREAVIVVVH